MDRMTVDTSPNRGGNIARMSNHPIFQEVSITSIEGSTSPEWGGNMKRNGGGGQYGTESASNAT